MLKSLVERQLKDCVQWNLRFAPSLTKEEKHLKSKYADLRKAKAMLQRYRETGSCKSPVKVKTKPRSEKHSKENDARAKKAIDFKKPSKQKAEIISKRPVSVRSFEEDLQPRSVKICGKHLTDDYLHEHFDEFGSVLKIRTNESKTSSVLTFRRPTSAKMAADFLDGSRVGGVKLHVAVLKRNMSWSNSNSPSPKIPDDCRNRGRSVYLAFHHGYLDAQDVEEFFQTVGRVTRIYLNTNEKKRYGFVRFEDEEQARRAIKEMDGEFFKGIKIRVSAQKFLAADSTNKPPKSERQNEGRELVSYDDLDISF